MGQPVATLEIALEMATGSSLAEVARFGGAVNGMAAQAIKDLERIEQASGGAINVTGAVGSLRQLQDAVGTTSTAAVREFNRIEQAAEKLNSQLERDIAVYGKTTVQIRDMRVEAAALAAEGQGQIELATRLRGTVGALRELEAANDDAGHAMGLNRNQTIIAQSAVLRFTDSIMAGQSPLRAFALEAHKGVEVLSMDDGGMAGGLSKVKALFSPFNIAVAAGTALVIAGASAWYSYVGSIEKFDGLAQGAGRTINTTGAALEASAEAAAKVGNITVGAARNIEAAYVQTGKIGMAVLPGLTAATNDFAVGTSQKLEQARDSLAKAFEDPAKGADELTTRYGILDAATLGYVHTLVDQGRETEAQQLLLKGLESAFDGAAAHANILARAWHVISSEASLAWTEMGKAIDRALTGGDHLERLNSLLAESQRRATGGLPTLGVITGQALGSTLSDSQLADMIAKERAAVAAEQQRQNMAEAHARAAAGLKVVDAYTGDDKLGELQSKLTSVNSVLAPGSGASADQLKAAREAQDAYTRAIETYIPPAEKKQKLAELDAQIAAAKAPQDKAALAAQREEVAQAGEVITKAQAAADAHAKGAQALATASKATENHAAELAREAAAQEAQIRNLNAVAAAYGVSGGAALIAEARVKAESKAIKDRGDVEAAVDREVRIAIAQRVADAAKSTAAMNAQSDAQEQVNGMVAAGLVPAARAAEMVKDRIADIPLLAAIEAAWLHGSTKDIDAATKALDDQRAARARNNDAIERAQFLSTMQAGGDQLDRLALEARLIGATASARVHDLAVLKAWQEAQKMPIDEALAYVKQQVEIADKTQAIADQTAQFNEKLRISADLSTSLGNSLSEAFGKGGKALGDMVAILGTYGAKQDEIDRQVRTGQLSQSAGAKESANLQITSLIGITDAAKGLFKEHSAGYKAMEAAEKALTIVQIARTAIDVAGGAARMFAELGPFAFPAVAAMLGVMASLGFSGGGGTSAADYSKGNTGTGTVLGDPTAQSASIKNALDSLKDIDNKTLMVSHDMLTALRNIENNIAGVASLVSRTDASGALASGIDTSSINLKVGAAGVGGGALAGFALGGPIGAALGAVLGGVITGLFGTTTKVIGDGLTALPKKLGDIVNTGYDLLSYADVSKTKHFFGISTGTSYSTQIGAGDPEVAANFTKIFQSLYQSIEAAAGPLGVATDTITSRLDNFVIDLGKINLKDLSGDDIQKQLEAVFSAASDTIAEAVLPGLEKYQKVGEGYYQTVVRVASTVEQVDAVFQQLGKSANSMGINVDMAIAGMFDSVDDFTTAANTYFQDYYTKGEQASAITGQLAKALGSMGLALPDTLDGFRQLVDAQDLTTAAGQATYSTLLQLAPTFYDLKTSLEGAKSAADILSEQQDLQNQLWQLEGNTVAIRQAQLAALDPSNRALQEQIYAVQDAQDAAKAASDLADAWKSVGDSIMDEINRIRGLDTTSGGGSFASLLGQFNAASTAARAGDQDAAKSLPEISKSLLDAAALAATSRQELDRVQAQTAASLQSTYDAIAQYSGTSSTDTASALTSASAVSSTATSANDNTAAAIADLKQVIAATQADLRSALAAIAGNTKSIDKRLDTVTSASGGEAISVTNAA